jgi:CRP-like cAMP-binding protein
VPRSAHVVALSDALVVSMSSSDFWDVLRTYPPVAEVTLKRLTKLVRHLSERLFEISTLPVKDRIHAELLHLARQHLRDNNTAVISPPPTHADIASRVGTHREAVTRAFNDLKSAGLIMRHEGELVICNVTELTRMVNEVLGK